MVIIWIILLDHVSIFVIHVLNGNKIKQELQNSTIGLGENLQEDIAYATGHWVLFDAVTADFLKTTVTSKFQDKMSAINLETYLHF